MQTFQIIALQAHAPHLRSLHADKVVQRMPACVRAGLAVLACAAAAALTACQSPIERKAPPATQLVTTLLAAPDVNPSASGRASPLKLRVYDLRSVTAFNQADFMALYNQDQATLGGDLVAREEIMLQPGEHKVVTRTLTPDTKAVAIVALYRDLEHAVWRATAPIRVGQLNTLQVHAQALKLGVQADAMAAEPR